VAWLPGFVGCRTQGLSLSFTTSFLQLEGHLGECVSLTPSSFGWGRQARSEFLCARVLMCLLLLLNQLGEGSRKGEDYDAFSGFNFTASSAISDSVLLLLKEGVFLPTFLPFMLMAEGRSFSSFLPFLLMAVLSGSPPML